jgi:hypothetical protein
MWILAYSYYIHSIQNDDLPWLTPLQQHGDSAFANIGGVENFAEHFLRAARSSLALKTWGTQVLSFSESTGLSENRIPKIPYLIIIMIVIKIHKIHKCLIGGLEHFLLFHILGILIPTDELIFFRGVWPTTNQMFFSVSKLGQMAICTHFFGTKHSKSSLRFFRRFPHLFGKRKTVVKNLMIATRCGFPFRIADCWFV